jgi:hypothetical protein
MGRSWFAEIHLSGRIKSHYLMLTHGDCRRRADRLDVELLAPAPDGALYLNQDSSCCSAR